MRFGILISFLLFAACGGIRRKPGAGKYSDHKILVGAVERSYIRYSPSAVEPNRLLLVLHGGGGKAKGMIWLAQDLPPLADTHGVLLIYPEGQGGHWNDGRADISKADDIAFLRALVTQVTGQEKIRRVYAAGMSNGGMMAQRIACEMPDLVQGVVSVAANLTEMLSKNCPGEKAAAVMFIAGKEDPIVPYQGGPIKVLLKERGLVLSIEDSLAFWSRRMVCAARADEKLTATVLHRGYDCKTGRLELYAVEGGGHAWPGGTAYLPEVVIGKTTRDFSASEKIIEFMR